MTIQEFYVESYGQLRNFHVKDLSPGLNVFLGPNASGKKTLMRFLNHVLLGATRYESPRAPLGGQKGGRIVMDDDVVIERLDHKIQPHGRVQSGADLRDIFLDRAIIESVFFVSLDQLSFSDLQNAQSFPGALLDYYSRLEHARKHLEGARDRLWRVRAASEIRTLEKELQLVHEHFSRLEQEHTLAVEKKKSLYALDLDSDRLSYYEYERRDELNHLEKLIRAYPYWIELHERNRVRAELNGHRAQQLEREVAMLEGTLRTILGNAWDSAELREELKTGKVDVWQAQMNDAQRALGEVLRSSEAQRERLGTVEAEYARMQESGDIADLRCEESILIAKLREKRREFAEILIAEQLLSEVIKPYEDEHQRIVYGRANEFIRRATDGEYEVVAGHPGEVEFVRSQNGTMHAESELSRGTRELILMLLRLSLVIECAERNRPLPLIMDDVMVHMDDEKAEAFAKVLAEVSKHVQILIFTSHEDTQQRLARYSDSQKTLTLKRLPSDSRSAYAQN